MNARVWRTDEQGTIVVTTDGNEYNVTALGKSADAPRPGNGTIQERRSRNRRSRSQRERRSEQQQRERRTRSEQR